MKIMIFLAQVIVLYRLCAGVSILRNLDYRLQFAIYVIIFIGFNWLYYLV